MEYYVSYTQPHKKGLAGGILTVEVETQEQVSWQVAKQLRKDNFTIVRIVPTTTDLNVIHQLKNEITDLVFK